MEPSVTMASRAGIARGNPSPAVHVHNLRVSYGSVRAVDGIDLTVQRGETFGLLGPNGAGKTTTLSVPQGLQQPESGSEVAILGLNIKSQAAEVRQRIGVSLQSTSLFERLTLVELLRFYAACYDRRMSMPEARKLLERFGLGEKANVYANQLSGGQQQRTALAVALDERLEVHSSDAAATSMALQTLAVLQGLSLVQAMRDYATEVAATAGWRLTLDLPAEGFPVLRQDVEEAVWQMLHEAITNVLRHASAKHVTIKLTAGAAGLILTIQDDGRGIDAEPTASAHFGLRGLNERAEILGGTLSVPSPSGGGTTLTIALPMGEHAAGRERADAYTLTPV